MSRSPTALMLNPDNSAFHLHAHAQDISDTVILVGDPKRVDIVTRYFDHIDVTRSHREFRVVTGSLHRRPLTVVSTGIGADNIDIVINELDMLVNFDLQAGTPRQKLRSLKIIRLGTCGALQPEIDPGRFIISQYGIGFDGLMHYYDYQHDTATEPLFQAIRSHFQPFALTHSLHIANADPALCAHFTAFTHPGITLTSGGFYGPQSRLLRAPLTPYNVLENASQFEMNDLRITNFEMETAAILALGQLLGHQCCSISTAIANRVTDKIHPDPAKAVVSMIENTLEKLSATDA